MNLSDYYKATTKKLIAVPGFKIGKSSTGKVSKAYEKLSGQSGDWKTHQISI